MAWSKLVTISPCFSGGRGWIAQRLATAAALRGEQACEMVQVKLSFKEPAVVSFSAADEA
jgi:hypothetical protein